MPAKRRPKRTRASVEHRLDPQPENDAKERTGAALQSLLTTPPGAYRPLRETPRKNRWAKSKFRN
jgi:hypothetical protein